MKQRAEPRGTFVHSRPVRLGGPGPWYTQGSPTKERVRKFFTVAHIFSKLTVIHQNLQYSLLVIPSNEWIDLYTQSN